MSDVVHRGIDVSRWQGEIDWAAVKAAGMHFVMIRASYGRTTDPMFEHNYRGATAAGLFAGAYHYLYAGTPDEAVTEAQFFLSIIEGLPFEYPVALDLEDTSLQHLSKQVLTDIVNSFAAAVEAAGYYCVLYSNRDWLVNRLNMDELRTDIWLAQWNHSENAPDWTDRYGIWQNSNKGRIDGISGDIDTDLSYRDYPAIMRERNLNNINAQNAINETNYRALYYNLLERVKQIKFIIDEFIMK